MRSTSSGRLSASLSAGTTIDTSRLAGSVPATRSASRSTAVGGMRSGVAMGSEDTRKGSPPGPLLLHHGPHDEHHEDGPEDQRRADGAEAETALLLRLGEHVPDRRAERTGQDEGDPEE